jgi:hypothetical protein
MILVDTGIGPVINGGIEGDDVRVEMDNITIHGDAPAKDCF